MAKLSKAKIAEKVLYELEIGFGVVHPYALLSIGKWLRTKWHPAVEGKFVASMDYVHWKTPKVEWTPSVIERIVIWNDPQEGLFVYIAGDRAYSDVFMQAFQDRLAQLPQAEVNELLGHQGLFDLSDYDKSDGIDGNLYTHEDG